MNTQPINNRYQFWREFISQPFFVIFWLCFWWEQLLCLLKVLLFREACSCIPRICSFSHIWAQLGSIHSIFLGSLIFCNYNLLHVCRLQFFVQKDRDFYPLEPKWHYFFLSCRFKGYDIPHNCILHRFGSI